RQVEVAPGEPRRRLDRRGGRRHGYGGEVEAGDDRLVEVPGAAERRGENADPSERRPLAGVHGRRAPRREERELRRSEARRRSAEAAEDRREDARAVEEVDAPRRLAEVREALPRQED